MPSDLSSMIQATTAALYKLSLHLAGVSDVAGVKPGSVREDAAFSSWLYEIDGLEVWVRRTGSGYSVKVQMPVDGRVGVTSFHWMMPSVASVVGGGK